MVDDAEGVVAIKATPLPRKRLCTDALVDRRDASVLVHACYVLNSNGPTLSESDSIKGQLASARPRACLMQRF